MHLSRGDGMSVIVHFVIPGTPADRAGISAGDELLSIDDYSVFRIGLLEDISAMFEMENGAERRLEIRRGYDTLSVTVVLEKYL